MAEDKFLQAAPSGPTDPAQGAAAEPNRAIPRPGGGEVRRVSLDAAQSQTHADDIHGVLLIDKPVGMTSRMVDSRIKHRLGRKVRVGHAGTLDPFATGLLPVLIGEGTKLSPFLTGCDKTYEAVLRLGAATDTADCEGTVVREAPVPVLTVEQVTAAMARLTGTFQQRVPVYSAVKRDGVALHRLARAGVAVEAPERAVTVKAFRLLELGAQGIRFECACAAGTYIRALGEQLAGLLGTAGHLTELRRLQVGSFNIAHAVPLEAVLAPRAMVPGSTGKSAITGALRPLEAVLDMATVVLGPLEVTRVSHGQTVPAGEGADLVQAHDQAGHLIAVLRRSPGNAENGDVWKVVRGFSQG
jgi:tRNA pseudouridine55 synthase